jgi:hypothetical protein
MLHAVVRVSLARGTVGRESRAQTCSRFTFENLAALCPSTKLQHGDFLRTPLEYVLKGPEAVGTLPCTNECARGHGQPDAFRPSILRIRNALVLGSPPHDRLRGPLQPLARRRSGRASMTDVQRPGLLITSSFHPVEEAPKSWLTPELSAKLSDAGGCRGAMVAARNNRVPRSCGRVRRIAL